MAKCQEMAQEGEAKILGGDEKRNDSEKERSTVIVTAGTRW
jgi:hypothetical protein